MLFPMTLSDLEWLSEIFNNTKHRAAYLRQLSFLLICVVPNKSDMNFSTKFDMKLAKLFSTQRPKWMMKENDASARPTNISLASCDLDLWPQLKKLIVSCPCSVNDLCQFASKSVCSFSKYCVYNLVIDERTDRTDNLKTWWPGGGIQTRMVDWWKPFSNSLCHFYAMSAKKQRVGHWHAEKISVTIRLCIASRSKSM